MLSPAMRYAKLVYHQSNVPSWGLTYLSQPRRSLLCMQLSLILPLLASLLSVRVPAAA